MIVPKQYASLFVTGATLGPLVDSLHNQCLLEYHVAPIHVGPWIASSWVVPPLLGVAYVLLGGVLPKVVSKWIITTKKDKNIDNNTEASVSVDMLRTKAFWAVASTAVIIKTSDILETHQYFLSTPPQANVWILAALAMGQWAVLDRSGTALVVATAAALGGPLAELPFVAHGVWTYLPEAADYFPFDSSTMGGLAQITGPCYFAVTMDSIALGRWFGSTGHTYTSK